MPNRIIKESICTSAQIDSLDAETECFFYRLMVSCDDYGRLDARLPIIKSKCYPLKSIDIKRLQEMMGVLSDACLIGLYSVNESPYLYLISWEKHQQIRAKKSKYPPPESGSAINCNHLKSSEIICTRNPIQSNTINNPIQSAVSDEKTSLPAVRSQKLGFDYSTNRFINMADNRPLFDSWVEAYPAVDVRGELKKMAAWLASNPKNKKSDIVRFANSWLSKEQDKAKPAAKTFYEITKEQEKADAVERYSELSKATDDELRALGLKHD